MKKEEVSSVISTRTSSTLTEEARPADSQEVVKRRSILKGIGMAGIALSTGALFATEAEAQAGPSPKSLTPGDAAILRFLAAAELLETDLWQQYAELGDSLPGSKILTKRPFNGSMVTARSTSPATPLTN